MQVWGESVCRALTNATPVVPSEDSLPLAMPGVLRWGWPQPEDISLHPRPPSWWPRELRMKGDPGRRHLIPAPGAEFPGLGWGQRVGSLAPRGGALYEGQGTGSQVWAQRCQAWVWAGTRPRTTCLKIAVGNQGECAEGRAVCPWQTHLLSQAAVCPLIPSRTYQSPPTASGKHPVISPMAPERTSLLATPKMGAISPWTLAQDRGWGTRRLVPMPKDSTGYCLCGLNNQWRGE